MRILFFSHYFPPDVGALASRTYAHCRRWVAAGHDVTVVTSAPNYPRGVLHPGYRNRLRQVEDWDGIRVVRVMTYLAANSGTWRRGLSYLSYMVSAAILGSFERSPDIVVASSPQFFCGWAGVFVAKLRRRPFILEVRDLWPESIVAVGALRPGSMLNLLGKLELAMYRCAERIVTVGEGYRQRLLARGADPTLVSVVMNGVDKGVFYPRDGDDELAGRLGATNRFVVMYCGTIGMAHGLEVVLDAASLLRQRDGGERVVFLVVGDGACRDELEDRAQRMGLDNVVFTGGVPAERVPELIALSNACLVHLRTADAFTAVMPSKIFEAAAMARPVILGVRGFAADFVREVPCGLCIEPENAEQLADSVLRLSLDGSLCERLGQAGYERVASQFDRDELARQYLDVIEGVATGSAR